MTPLFWIALTWVLAATAVGRLPLHQRPLPGAVLLVAAGPIVLFIAIQINFIAAILALAAILSMFPNTVHLAMARYRGENVAIDANVLRYLVVPGEL